MKEFILMLHPTFGVLAILGSVWVFTEVLNASAANQGRIRTGSMAVAVLMWLTYIVGGYWYVVFYAADKALIKKGPWPFAHGLFMESKEHIFLMLLLLATLLPIVAYKSGALAKAGRTVMLWTAGLVALIGLGMEGAGAGISMGVKVALLAARAA